MDLIKADVFKTYSEKEKFNYLKQLDAEIKQTEINYDMYKSMQLALKTVINGAYGAFAHPKFVVSNKFIANAITTHGRDIILYMLTHIQHYFYEQWHLDTEVHELLKETYIGYDGTGSVYMVNTKNEIIQNKAYKSRDKYETVTELENGALLELMKEWYLTKGRLTPMDTRKIKTTLKGKAIDLELRYKRILCNFDKLRPIDGTIIGDRDSMGGYDIKYHKEDLIRYGDTDSLYVSYIPVVDSLSFEGDKLEFILALDKIFLKKLFNGWLEEYAAKYQRKNIQDFELETINKNGLHLQKKMYINNCIWEDGIFYDDLTQIRPKGVDIVRSSTPPFVRGKKNKGGIWNFINYLFLHPKDMDIREILAIMKDLKKQYMATDIEEISYKTTCSNYFTKVLDDQRKVDTVLGTHFGVKAAALHNFLLNRNAEFKSKYDLITSGNVKWYFIKDNAYNDRVAYKRSFHPVEVFEKEKIQCDYDRMFELSVLSIVNRFGRSVGLPEITKRLSVLNSLFGGNMTQKIEDNQQILAELEEDDDNWDF
jgi:hypothetical protein